MCLNAHFAFADLEISISPDGTISHRWNSCEILDQIMALKFPKKLTPEELKQREQRKIAQERGLEELFRLNTLKLQKEE